MNSKARRAAFASRSAFNPARPMSSIAIRVSRRSMNFWPLPPWSILV